MASEPFASFGGSGCPGGPTAVEVKQGRLWAAVDGRLVSMQARGGGSPVGSVRPWGLVERGGRLYATEPGCDSSSADSAPGGGLLAATCRLVRSDFDGNVIDTVADVCGTGIALQPGTAHLTVATRDGRIVVVDPAAPPGESIVSTLASGLAGDPAEVLAWDGATLYASRAGGGVYRVSGGGLSKVGDTPRAGGLLATSAYGLEGFLLVGTPGAYHLVDLSSQRPVDVADAPGLGGALTTGNEIGIFAGGSADVLRLTGSYQPLPLAPPPPPAPVPAREAAPEAPPPHQQVAAAPPPAPAPPPPAPPAPPATAPVPAPAPAPAPVANAGFVAQQGTAANVAMVPGQQDPEAAIRYAATVRGPAPAAAIWLLLLLGAGSGAGAVGLAARRQRQPAWAHAEALRQER
ncbi:MAG TPA: hypothetical protein VGA69_02250 [Nitriliruptorales bacterium]